MTQMIVETRRREGGGVRRDEKGARMKRHGGNATHFVSFFMATAEMKQRIEDFQDIVMGDDFIDVSNVRRKRKL